MRVRIRRFGGLSNRARRQSGNPERVEVSIGQCERECRTVRQPPRTMGTTRRLSGRVFSWFFCRLWLMSRAAYLPLPSTPCEDRLGLHPEFRTSSRSPEVSSTAFRTQPPDLQPVPLMNMHFVVNCQLVRHRMPPIRFFYIGSHVCSTLLSDLASRRRPCASPSSCRTCSTHDTNARSGVLPKRAEVFLVKNDQWRAWELMSLVS